VESAVSSLGSDVFGRAVGEPIVVAYIVNQRWCLVVTALKVSA
jgi:hypothetical protein